MGDQRIFNQSNLQDCNKPRQISTTLILYLKGRGELRYLFICRPNESLLFTSSMLWNAGCGSVEEFYNQCVGVPVQLLPTVLGLKLAVDLELGSR